MSGAVIIAITIVSCIIGYVLNVNYGGKYHESAVVWPAFVAQAFLVMCMLLTWPNPEPTTWFFIWTVLTVVSYVIAIVACKSHAESQHATKADVYLAILSQIILPLGVALVIIIIIGMMLGVIGGGKKKRR